jgi:restriction endonuclease NaeI
MSDESTLFDPPGMPDAGAQPHEPIDAVHHPQHDIGGDSGLQAVLQWFRSDPDLVSKFGAALRQSMDEVLDGQRTGRFDISTLEKTEKTYLGTKVEIVVRATFELPRGQRMDYRVAGHDIDSKFTSLTSWSIPTEAMGHLCLLTSTNDHRGTFNVGVVRITPDALNQGQNKDAKKTLSKEGRGRICWLAREAPLPENLLLSLPAGTVAAIMQPRSGQQRINELLRRVQGRVIGRTTAVTVARQADGLKRCRDARSRLAPHGIVVLGHQNDSPVVARSLGLPIPPKGSFLSIRLVPVPSDTSDRAIVERVEGTYAIARSDDPESPAPSVNC